MPKSDKAVSKTKRKTTNALHNTASELLARVWSELLALPLDRMPADPEIGTVARKILEGKEIGWRYSIYIQVLGKAANFELNALCLQDKFAGNGAWDAREFAKSVVVPWNAAAGAPLGQSGDPYVSNTFRHPSYGPEMRRDRKSPELYDLAERIVQKAENAANPKAVEALLRLILAELRRHLQGKDLDYPAPKRVSLPVCTKCIDEYLAAKSGGARLQALVFAAFRTLASETGAYSRVESRHVNAADSASGAAGDIECWRANQLRLAVEVKDRVLTISQVQESIAKARINEVGELLFVVRSSQLMPVDEQAAMSKLIDKEFSAGLNLYVESAAGFFSRFLLFLLEDGRRKFLLDAGVALQLQKADFQHRLAWSAAVRAL